MLVSNIFQFTSSDPSFTICFKYSTVLTILIKQTRKAIQNYFTCINGLPMCGYIFLSLLDVLSLTSNTSVLKARCLLLYTRFNFPVIGKNILYSLFQIASVFLVMTIIVPYTQSTTLTKAFENCKPEKIAVLPEQ